MIEESNQATRTTGEASPTEATSPTRPSKEQVVSELARDYCRLLMPYDATWDEVFDQAKKDGTYHLVISTTEEGLTSDDIYGCPEVCNKWDGVGFRQVGGHHSGLTRGEVYKLASESEFESFNEWGYLTEEFFKLRYGGKPIDYVIELHRIGDPSVYRCKDFE